MNLCKRIHLNSMCYVNYNWYCIYKYILANAKSFTKFPQVYISPLYWFTFFILQHISNVRQLIHSIQLRILYDVKKIVKDFLSIFIQWYRKHRKLSISGPRQFDTVFSRDVFCSCNIVIVKKKRKYYKSASKRICVSFFPFNATHGFTL